MGKFSVNLWLYSIAAALLSLTFFSPLSEARIQVVLDTDMKLDIDDTAAAHWLAKMHSAGHMNLLAIVLNSTRRGRHLDSRGNLVDFSNDDRTVATAGMLAQSHGISPFIGAASVNASTGHQPGLRWRVDLLPNEHAMPVVEYWDKVLDRAPIQFPTNTAQALTAEQAYRQAFCSLRGNQKLVIISVGYVPALYELLQAGADPAAANPCMQLGGANLIRRYVDYIVFMGGRRGSGDPSNPGFQGDHNFHGLGYPHTAATVTQIADLVPAYFVTEDIRPVMRGSAVEALVNSNAIGQTPFFAIDYYFKSLWMERGVVNRNPFPNRNMWDFVAAYLGVYLTLDRRHLESHLSIISQGRLEFHPTNGRTRWQRRRNHPNHYLVEWRNQRAFENWMRFAIQ